MRGELNSELYGPLQTEYEAGKVKGTDVWIHKNRQVYDETRLSTLIDSALRMPRLSGIWGYQSALDLYLKENGIRTLFFAGVNTDQVRYSPLLQPQTRPVSGHAVVFCSVIASVIE